MMRRTQILLSSEEWRALAAAAQRTGRSMTALIREAVQIVYGTERPSEDDLVAMRRAFGSWRDHDLDGVTVVDRLRSGEAPY